MFIIRKKTDTKQYRKHPPKNRPLLAARRNPRKHRPTPRRHTKSRMTTSEKRERTRKAKYPDREKTWGKQVKQSGVRKKHAEFKTRNETPGHGGKIRCNHQNPEMGQKRALSEKEQERECGEIFR